MINTLFRAWDKDSKRMLEVSYISFEVNGLFDVTVFGTEEDDKKRIASGGSVSITADGKPWEYGFLQIQLRDFVLMQYSGIKDKNLVKIFEGDIVKGEGSEGIYYAPVVFQDCKFTIDPFQAIQVENPKDWKEYLKRLDPKRTEYYDAVKTNGFTIHWSDNGYHTLKSGWSNLEVIGNIYENPDLLIRKEK